MNGVNEKLDRLTPPGPYETHVAWLEAELARVREECADLRSRDALKTQLLANISHDLRTPLSAVITHAEILRDGILGPLTERQSDSVQGIITGGRQLLGQVGEILTYARAAANQLTLNPSTFRVHEVLEQLSSVNESLLTRKGLEFHAVVGDDVPPIQADREKFAHIIGNLVGNAIGFTAEGGRVWVSVTLRKEDEGNCLLTEVGDTGVGIAPEHHDLIFREFAQVDPSPSRSHHGTGLGLTIARKLVALHGGRIWVESALGEGSRFYFTIPVSCPR